MNLTENKCLNFALLNNAEQQVRETLATHKRELESIHMRALFANDPKRNQRFECETAELYLDYSKNRITKQTLDLLFELAGSCQVKERVQELSHQKAGHISLRKQSNNDCPEVEKMRIIANRLHKHQWRGFSKKTMTDVVNIGIGGSDLGQRLVVDALQNYHGSKNNVSCHFVSNMDPADILNTLANLDPQQTLFVVTSKSFITQETLKNMQVARQWLCNSAGDEFAWQQQMIAVTSQTARAIEEGFLQKYVLKIPKQVVGRYSLWSSAGLSIALALGMPAFQELLDGAREMDEHFFSAPFERNMPVILALLGIWYINFWRAKNHAIIPYSQHLRYLPQYLQQIEMESNGKQVNNRDQQINYDTAPIIWGGVGSNSQHSFHQKLLQGSGLSPIDFIAVINPVFNTSEIVKQHQLLLLNCFSQGQLLLDGNAEHSHANSADILHEVIEGNAPSNTLLMSRLTPQALGALLALYEHKVFVQSVIWGVNPYDQWAVEMSKLNTESIALEMNRTQENKKTGVLGYFHRNKLIPKIQR